MKVRVGFVSNSSSGSYIIIGWKLGRYLNSNILKLMFENSNIETNKFLHMFNDDVFFGVLLEYTNEQMGYENEIHDRRLQDIIDELSELIEVGKKKNFNIEKIETISGYFDV